MSINRRQQLGGRLSPLVRLALALAAIYALWLAQAWHPARADGTWLAGTVGSYHVERPNDYNERNWGLGAEFQMDPEKRVIVGAYRNSLYRTSAYAGLQWTPLEFGPLRLGAMVAAASGYQNSEGGSPVVLLGAPLIAIEHRGVGMNLLVIPRIADAGGVLALQIKFRIN